jgi:hypothetical protein
MPLGNPLELVVGNYRLGNAIHNLNVTPHLIFKRIPLPTQPLKLNSTLRSRSSKGGGKIDLKILRGFH